MNNHHTEEFQQELSGDTTDSMQLMPDLVTPHEAESPIAITIFNGGYADTTPHQTVSYANLEELAELFLEPEPGEKDGRYFVRAECRGTRSDENTQPASIAIVDADHGTEGRPCPHPVFVNEALEGLGWEYIIYTSFSHTTDNPRYRIIFRLHRKVYGQEVGLLYTGIIKRLAGAGIHLAANKESKTLSQPWYFPRYRTQEQKDNYFFAVGGTIPLPVDAIIEAPPEDVPKVEPLTPEQLDLLKGNVPPCISFFANDTTQPATQSRNFNLIAMALIAYGLSMGHNEHDVVCGCRDFIDNYPFSDSLKTPKAREDNFRQRYRSMLNGDYTFSCGTVLALKAPGSAFDCEKQCALRGKDHKYIWEFEAAYEMVIELAEVVTEVLGHRKCTRKIVADIFSNNSFDKMELDDMRSEVKKKLGFNKATLDEIARDAAAVRGEGGDELPPQSHVATALLPQFKDSWFYSTEKYKWYQYDGHGLWEGRELDEYNSFTKKAVDSYGDIASLGYPAGYLKGIKELLAYDLSEKVAASPQHIIPFKNGVLNTETNDLYGHEAKYHFTWRLEFDYDPDADCPFFLAWLKDRLETERRIQLVHALICAILLGLVELQFFIELHGAAGAGKSVFQWLLEQLVGAANVGSTDIKTLEESRFEAAGLVDKKLILIADSKEFGGEAAILKAITGNDRVRIEQKNVKTTGEGYRLPGIVVVAANQPLQITDHSNAVSRRRVPIYWEKPVSESVRRKDIKADLQQELPGIVNWALGMPLEEVAAVIKANQGDSQSEDARSGLLRTNHLAAWLHDNTVYAPGEKSNVGVARRDDLFDEASRWLYPNYAKYLAEDSKFNKPLSVKKFSEALHVLLTETLRLKRCHRLEKGRDGRQFEGLVLRGSSDNRKSPIDVAYAPIPEQAGYEQAELF